MPSSLAVAFTAPKKVWFGLIRLGRIRGRATAGASRNRQAAHHFIYRQLAWHYRRNDGDVWSLRIYSPTIGGANFYQDSFPGPVSPPFPLHPEMGIVDQCLGYLEMYFSKLSFRPMRARHLCRGVQADSGDIVPPADFSAEVARPVRSPWHLAGLDEVKVGLGRPAVLFLRTRGYRGRPGDPRQVAWRRTAHERADWAA